MTTQTQTLTDFLLARIAEDENSAKNARSWGTPRRDTARELAECDSKRRIIAAVEAHREGEWEGDPIHGAILRALALPYADHPDFREEWRP